MYEHNALDYRLSLALMFDKSQKLSSKLLFVCFFYQLQLKQLVQK